MISAIFFDLDGTLIDTPRGIVGTFSEVFKSIGKTGINPTSIRSTIGLPLEKAFGKLLEIEPPDERIADAIRRYQEFFKEIVLPKAKQLIFPGVQEGLTQLKKHEFRLCVATSKFFTSAEALLKAADLWDCFEIVVGADQVTKPKPDPEMAFYLMKKLNVMPENSIMVGDTTHDLIMARDANIRSIAVTYGIHDIKTLEAASPTWIAGNFSEVVNSLSLERASCLT